MEELPTSLLLQQEHARPRTGEELETFGKHAASCYLSGRCGSLSEAVVETVKSAGLAPEQVRRVVEFANTSAYLEKFASAGPGHKVVNFAGGPASFPDVIRDLNDGGGGSLQDSGMGDYSLPPPDMGKMAVANLARLGLTDAKLAAAFQVEEAVLPYEEPLREVFDTRDKVASLYDEATHELNGLETRYLDLCDLLYGQVKQASLSGVPLGHLLTVWQTVTEDPEFFKVAFGMLSPRLIDNEVFHSEVDIVSSIEKTAGAGLVNSAHPLVGIFGDYCETLQKLAATREVHEDLVGQLDILDTYIPKAASKAASAREAAGYIPKAWGAARTLAARASEPVGKVVGALGGETAGQIASGAVKYSPHIAAGLAGEEVYQHAKNNPAAQAATNFVAGRVPYTHQNMIRQYNLQMGYS